MYKQITINNQLYKISPLKCKHLREITEVLLLKEPNNNLLSLIEHWGSFIYESLKVKHPEVTRDFVENLTLEQVKELQNSVLEISGIKFVSNSESKEGIDWGLIYGCAAVSTGWTYRDVDEHTLAEIEELFDYLADHPTAASILAAVHKVTTRAGSLKGKKWKDIDPNRFEAGLAEVPLMLNQGVEQLDTEFKQSIELAAKLQEALRKKAN